MRDDISEGLPGIPLEFSVTVIDYTSCSPLANVFIDIWHCDALGVYSGYTKESVGQIGTPDDNHLGHVQASDNTTFLRGTLITDKDGVATFRTIMPGWYETRVTHIHTKIHVPYQKTWSNPMSAYEESHVVHVGQFYFNDTFLTETSKEFPYNTGTAARTLMPDDKYYYTEIPLTDVTLRGSKLNEGIVGKAKAIVYPYWEAVEPEGFKAASMMSVRAGVTSATVSGGRSTVGQWIIHVFSALGGLVVGAATVLAILHNRGKLSSFRPQFELLTLENEEAGLRMVPGGTHGPACVEADCL